jgi:hypothetical protein
MMKSVPAQTVDQWYFGFKTTRCASEQEAKLLETVAVRMGNSCVLSHHNIIWYNKRA